MSDYPEQERHCYGPYPTGDGGERYADPLLTHRHLTALFEGDVGRAVRELTSDNPGIRHQATERAAWAACEAFGLPPFDPATGAGTVAEVALTVLRDFLVWLSVKKKSTVTTSASPSAESPASFRDPSPTSSTAV